MKSVSAVVLLALVAVVLAQKKASSIPTRLRSIYDARKGGCDFFVSPYGSDSNYGTDYDHAFKTLACALNPECNEGIESKDVVCLLAGNYAITETVIPRLSPDSSVVVKALGDDGSAVLDGKGKVLIFNAMSVVVSFNGIKFTNGFGNSGGAVYSERFLRFDNCVFEANKATIHGGAVMAGRNVEFHHCTFLDNSAKYAGAVRVSDIGSALFISCNFYGNKASDKGGAVATQIEKPEENSVVFKNALFCFNDAQTSPNVYNYRTATHECEHCRFNTAECCSSHGKVVTSETSGVQLPPGSSRTRGCLCESGWSGVTCAEESKADAPAHTEL